MKLRFLLPFVFLATLVIFFWHELFHVKTDQSSQLIGEKLPTFNLPDLWQPQMLVSNSDLDKQKVILLHVWATWCYACRYEHEMLMKIKDNYHIPIYSVDYKDDPLEAKNYLHENGNPYHRTVIDEEGSLTIDLGVYGTPETFILDKNGDIIYRHIGVITDEIWQQILYPLIKKAS